MKTGLGIKSRNLPMDEGPKQNFIGRVSLKVELVLDGVSNLPVLPDNTQSLWLRWKIGSHSGESKPGLPNKQNLVEFAELVTVKSSFKRTPKGDAYERKSCVLTLKGKRNRSTFTLGTVSIDLSQYVSEQSTALHLPFDAGSTSLNSNTEFLGKVRVLTSDAALTADPLDVSSTLNDDSDDDEDKTNNTDDSFLKGRKFLLTTEEVARKAPQRGGAVSPALQIQGYEEELKEMRRRFAQEKKEQETRHQGEVTRLNQLMKTANQENLAKMKALQQELQRAKEATSSVIVSTLRAQKDEAENQAREKTSTIQSLREQLSDALEKITQFTATNAKNEANLQRAEKELAMLRERLKEAERRRESPEKSSGQKVESKQNGKKEEKSVQAASSDVNSALSANQSVNAKKEERKETSLNLSSKSRVVESKDESIPVSARRRSKAVVELPSVDEGGSSLRMIVICLLFVALGFVVKKVLMK